MMRNLCIAALLVCGVVHAQPIPLVSSPTSNFDGNLEVFVAFSECIRPNTFNSDSIDLVPSSLFGQGSCDEMIANQQFRCTFSTQTDLGSRTTYRKVSASIPGGAVLSSTGASSEPSNRLFVEYMGALGAGSFNVRETESFDNLDQTYLMYMYTFVNHPIFSVTTPGIQVVRASGSVTSPMKILSLMYTGTSMEFQVRANAGDVVTASVGAGSVIDGFGHENLASRVITTTVIKPGPDCVMSEWSEWSECSATCTSFQGEFASIAGSRNRQRSIIRAAREGGIACGAVTAQDTCNSQLCEFGSFPQSGEIFNECFARRDGECVPNEPRSTNPNAAGFFQEQSGCECKAGCELTGSCCQGWYINQCCSEGDCLNRFAQFVYTGVRLQCDAAQCLLSTPKRASATSSYFCYCDAQCTVTQAGTTQCCGGRDSRNNICQQ